ncbi:flagellar motor switch protein FliN/FliY [Motilibacter rhizosphaerae]|uniref:Flagellar motor switch protein FliN/FliY n=1 Tax=Motilibacter rhizosphaerae TaxID=598652 RepID=A0A4Q7NW53_9ACTN|nr:flagellar motor switch protein FliN [Motilibacter rhizosphaerae]RZS91437.1 flagellar motor switch protein FliN/FliY [Motilibacter rhizosphaerae]
MSTSVPQEIIAAVVAAATAAAPQLPASSPLAIGAPVMDLAALPLPANAATAVVADLGGGVRGTSLVIVPTDLVEALQQSPLGQLDLASAVRPGLAAAAEAFGQAVLDAPLELPIDVALERLAGAGAAVAVPLLDNGQVVVVYAAAISATGAARPAAGGGRRPQRNGGLELLRDVVMEVTAELGRTRMTVRELLSLTPGSVVELDRAAGSPADLLVNGTLIARGEVVVVDEEYGIRITELVGPGADAEGAA